jgi:hypothetical protein
MTDAEPGWKWSENRNEDVASFTDRQICSAYPTDESKQLINQSSLFVIAESFVPNYCGIGRLSE